MGFSRKSESLTLRHKLLLQSAACWLDSLRFANCEDCGVGLFTTLVYILFRFISVCFGGLSLFPCDNSGVRHFYGRTSSTSESTEFSDFLCPHLQGIR